MSSRLIAAVGDGRRMRLSDGRFRLRGRRRAGRRKRNHLRLIDLVRLVVLNEGHEAQVRQVQRLRGEFALVLLLVRNQLIVEVLPDRFQIDISLRSAVCRPSFRRLAVPRAWCERPFRARGFRWSPCMKNPLFRQGQPQADRLVRRERSFGVGRHRHDASLRLGRELDADRRLSREKMIDCRTDGRVDLRRLVQHASALGGHAVDDEGRRSTPVGKVKSEAGLGVLVRQRIGLRDVLMVLQRDEFAWRVGFEQMREGHVRRHAIAATQRP